MMLIINYEEEPQNKKEKKFSFAQEPPTQKSQMTQAHNSSSYLFPGWGVCPAPQHCPPPTRHRGLHRGRRLGIDRHSPSLSSRF